MTSSPARLLREGMIGPPWRVGLVSHHPGSPESPGGLNLRASGLDLSSRTKGVAMCPSPLRQSGRWLAVVLCLSPLVLAGCPPQTATVKGKVYLDGVPLKGGSVALINPGGFSASGDILEDGSYVVHNVSTGTVKVCVDTESINPKGKSAPTYSPPKGAPVPEGGYNPGEGARANKGKRYIKIPEKYGQPDTTDLTLTITGTQMEHDIQLKK
jgi:hypothetical protein